jgi:hypothetical protein
MAKLVYSTKTLAMPQNSLTSPLCRVRQAAEFFFEIVVVAWGSIIWSDIRGSCRAEYQGEDTDKVIREVNSKPVSVSVSIIGSLLSPHCSGHPIQVIPACLSRRVSPPLSLSSSLCGRSFWCRELGFFANLRLNPWCNPFGSQVAGPVQLVRLLLLALRRHPGVILPAVRHAEEPGPELPLGTPDCR